MIADYHIYNSTNVAGHFDVLSRCRRASIGLQDENVPQEMRI